MKLVPTTVAVLLAQLVTVHSLDSSDLHFLTDFVNDVKSHLTDYIGYIETATGSFPDGLTSLAIQVQTYTDDGYTSLLSSGADINISEIETFATHLPWYSSRLAGNAVTGGESKSTTTKTTATSTATTSTGTSTSTTKSTSAKTTKSSTTTTKAGTTTTNGGSSVDSASIVPPGTTTTANDGNQIGAALNSGSFLFSLGTFLALLI